LLQIHNIDKAYENIETIVFVNVKKPDSFIEIGFTGGDKTQANGNVSLKPGTIQRFNFAFYKSYIGNAQLKSPSSIAGGF
jgi:hypothetical protein